MIDRAQSKAAFLCDGGWGAARIDFLAGDASNRSYERLTHADGRTAVLMDAPPDCVEDVRPFIEIGAYLCQRGLSAPRVYAQDRESGWLLLEDLGNALFTRRLSEHPGEADMLYGAALDVLTRLHDGQQPSLRRYDATTMSEFACLAYEWYRGAAPDLPKRDVFRTALHDLLAPLDTARHVLVLRDFHAENLLWLPERVGAARVGLLDFQDATLGHPAFDVVSLLQDARRDVPPELEARMRARFIEASGADPQAFEQAYRAIGVQRNLRILGVFARLSLRDGKAHYIDLIPRVWGLLQRNLAHPEMGSIARLVAQDLPAPDPEHLVKLKPS